MPSTLDAPVLQVDANVIHKVDTSNPQNLFSMWTVFARCADSVAQGRRLENLSWRLWTRETFCVEEAAAAHMSSSAPSTSFAMPHRPAISITPPQSQAIPKRNQPSTDEVPQLSGSVESVADEEAVEFASESGPVEIVRPRIQRLDSCGSSRSRGRERHITSDDLEKMVVSIVQEKEPLKAGARPETSFDDSAPLNFQPAEPEALFVAPDEARTVEPTPVEEQQPAAVPAPAPAPVPVDTGNPVPSPKQIELVAALSSTTNSSKEAAPTDSVQKSKSTTEIIRGFSPSHLPIVLPQVVTPPSSDEHILPAPTDDNAIPDPTSSPQAKPVESKKATFALGGSSSCEDSLSDPSRSLEMHKSAVMSQMMKRKAAPASEEEGSLKSAMHSFRSGQARLAQKKQTSFSNQLVTRTIPAAAAASDDGQSESDDIDESAIDDDEDDSSDWEDSNEESGRSSMDDKNLFQRVDSRVHLPSRRSLITLMIQRSQHELKNGLTTSQSTTGLPRARAAHQPPSLVASPNDSDDAALMMRHRARGPSSTLRPINEVPRSAAQPIMTTATGANYAPALSPRTNRRNMLSTELTESLRRHLLWERSQKTSTANAVLKRRHTSHDVANLKQYPEPVHMNKDNDANANSWDQYLNRDAFNGYHAKGW
ncbi:hypothetical protein SPI_05126 [Niveomyces insectorum RCEF 264]|uniref:Uncharacterized protein n=1 Tax=Niveomyces insectorum RCEF 264 TaxID=1081102 RepID=A0A167TZ86_9HYPO|nr:hypothetical protein SPI_05126 [Niveomyces insectorum RCEF 264]